MIFWLFFWNFMGTVHIPSRVPQFANAQPHILKKELIIDAIFLTSPKVLVYHDFFKIWWPPFGVAPCSVRHYLKPFSLSGEITT